MKSQFFDINRNIQKWVYSNLFRFMWNLKPIILKQVERHCQLMKTLNYKENLRVFWAKTFDLVHLSAKIKFFLSLKMSLGDHVRAFGKIKTIFSLLKRDFMFWMGLTYLYIYIYETLQKRVQVRGLTLLIKLKKIVWKGLVCSQKVVIMGREKS